MLLVRKIYTSWSFLKKISRVMLERAEFNLFERALLILGIFLAQKMS